MCRGDITQLSCGHTLQHITPCPSSPPSSLAPCNVVAWDRHHIRDTCAACHPGTRKLELRAEYEARHARLMARALRAKREGDEEGVRVLGGEVRRLVAWQRVRMGESLEVERWIGRRGVSWR